MKNKVVSFICGIIGAGLVVSAGWLLLGIGVFSTLRHVPMVSFEMLGLVILPAALTVASYGAIQLVARAAEERSHGSVVAGLALALIAASGQMSCKIDRHNKIGDHVNDATHFVQNAAHFVEKEALPSIKKLPGIRNFFEQEAAPAVKKPAQHKRRPAPKKEEEEVPLYYQPADY